MHRFLLLAVLAGSNMVHAQTENKTLTTHIDFIVSQMDGLEHEFTELYDVYCSDIPNSTSLMLADILLDKGFECTSSGRGNMPQGARIVSKIFESSDARCEVSKLYYHTDQEDLYRMTERIRCTSLK